MKKPELGVAVFVAADGAVKVLHDFDVSSNFAYFAVRTPVEFFEERNLPPAPLIRQRAYARKVIHRVNTIWVSIYEEQAGS